MTVAWRQFKQAVQASARRWRAMTTPDLVRNIVAMADESGLAFNEQTIIRDILKQLAALGSIEAVGAMVATGVPDDEVAAAMSAVIHRSPDAVEGCAVESLTHEMERWADEEVAAGRMTKVWDKAKGCWLYSREGEGG